MTSLLSNQHDSAGDSRFGAIWCRLAWLLSLSVRPLNSASYNVLECREQLLCRTFITSSKQIFFYPAFVCLSVCWQLNKKTTSREILSYSV